MRENTWQRQMHGKDYINNTKISLIELFDFALFNSLILVLFYLFYYYFYLLHAKIRFEL